MEGLGWDGGAEVPNSPSIWSNIYQPYLNYYAAVNGVDLIPNQEIQRTLSQPFSDNSSKYSTLAANYNVEEASIIAPTSLWQQQSMTHQPLGTTDPVNDGSLQQDCGLSGVLSNMRTPLDSLDCLLSTTNSNTKTSVEDDGGAISSSMVLPEHPKNFWNFGPGSSREFDCNNVSNDKGKEKEGTSKKRGRSGGDDVDHNKEGSFKAVSEPGPPKPKRSRPGKNNYNLTSTTSSTISFQLQQLSPTSSIDQAEPDQEAIAQMKEMMYQAAAFRLVNMGPEVVEKPKRKNVRTSSDPQTVAARQRRERISDRIRVLQRIVPGGTKMDTASMLDEAANYLKFLQTQIKSLENLGPKLLDSSSPSTTNCNLATNSVNLSFSSMPFTHSVFGPMQGHIPLFNNPNYYNNIHPSSV